MKQYEADTTNVRNLMIFVMGLLALLVITVFVISFFINVLGWIQPDRVAMKTVSEGPDLVESWRIPARERLEMEKEAHQRLNSYEWIDREQGIVRIPLEHAIQIHMQNINRRESSAVQQEVNDEN